MSSESIASPPQVPALRIIVFIVAWLGLSGLIVGAWLRPVLPGGWAVVLLGLALMAFPVWSLLDGMSGASYPSALTRLWILRPFWYAMAFLPVLAVATVAGGLLGWPFGKLGEFGRLGLAGGAGVLLVASIAGYLYSRRLEVKHITLTMPRLPAAFEGVRVVQISDLHVGPHTRKDFLARVRDTVNEARPDLIAITGDQVDDYAADVDIFREAFGDLEAALGVFAVAGNHDVYAGWNKVRQGLTEAGFKVLVNESVAVERDGQVLYVAGTGDPAGHGPLGRAPEAVPDIDRTLEGVPSNAAVLAMAHNPALWPALARRGVDLTLSGHTHYGQFAVPKLGWSLASPFLEHAMGIHRKGQSLLYIHPGTNYWGIPFRLGTPPQVAVITLTRSDLAEAALRNPQNKEFAQ